MTKLAERRAELAAKPVLDAGELHELTGVSVSTIRRAIRDGALPTRRLGRRVWIPTDAALSWLAPGRAGDDG